MAFYLTLILATLVVSSSQCVRNETGSTGRFVGLNADDGQFPYAAVIEVFNGSLWIKCGGSFIAQKWVLSAAKCVDRMIHGIIYLGVSMLRSSEVAYIVYPSAVRQYPLWDDKTNFGDLALIRIPKTDICENVFPVPLPSRNSMLQTFERKIAFASGWNDNVLRLQWLQVTVMANYKCAKAYKHATESIICTNVANTPCSAEDFGAPLLSVDDGVLIGLLSTTIQHNRACIMVYTRITSYLTWIEYITGTSL